MKRPSRDITMLQVAAILAERSTCARRRVGCVLTDSQGRVLSMGHNGVPMGMPHCIDAPCQGAKYKPGTGLDLCEAIHAEQNALMFCSDIMKVDTCYVTVSVCNSCCKMLLNSSCKRIVFLEEYPHKEAKLLWKKAGRLWQKGKLPRQPKEVIVYGLTTVLDGYKTRYIGQSRTLDSRIKGHLDPKKGAKGEYTKVKAWIVSREKAGYPIIITIIKRDATWNKDEIFFIANYRARGFDLLNMTDGGDGGEMPEESIRRGIEKRKARPRTEKELAADAKKSSSMKKLIEERGGHWTKGKKLSPEHIEKLVLIHTGAKRPPSVGEKISKANKGRKLTEEQKVKMRGPKSEEHKDNLRGPKSEAHKAALRKPRPRKKKSHKRVIGE